MTGTYYQGEDITINISLFEDKNIDEKVDISNYRVDLLLISGRDNMLYASTDTTSSLVDSEIVSNDDYSLSVNFSSEQTAMLSEGAAKVEVRLTNSDTGEVVISSNDQIFIEGSKISKLD